MTAEERADRRCNDLPHEPRVARTGLQIIFGVLLIAVFQPVSTDLGHHRPRSGRAHHRGAGTPGRLVGLIVLRVVVPLWERRHCTIHE
ncbi:DUF6328 family protein [Streptomyces bullii]|uniref:DUF6328 family protein n=1 Tax=Streptomyces bullii TaxID=349910 RepID=A0ABW0UV06_9ACTN